MQDVFISGKPHYRGTEQQIDRFFRFTGQFDVHFDHIAVGGDLPVELDGQFRIFQQKNPVIAAAENPFGGDAVSFSVKRFSGKFRPAFITQSIFHPVDFQTVFPAGAAGGIAGGIGEKYIRLYGPERMVYGTDYPLWDPVTETKRFFNLKLTDAEFEQICHKTAENFLNL
jgi:hypothetical protein